MIEVLSALANGVCKNCRTPIRQTVGEWSPPTWHHAENGRPECPGAPLAEPVPDSVVEVPQVQSRTHWVPLSCREGRHRITSSGFCSCGYRSTPLGGVS